MTPTVKIFRVQAIELGDVHHVRAGWDVVEIPDGPLQNEAHVVKFEHVERQRLVHEFPADVHVVKLLQHEPIAVDAFAAEGKNLLQHNKSARPVLYTVYILFRGFKAGKQQICV